MVESGMNESRQRSKQAVFTRLKSAYRWLANRWVTHPVIFAAVPMVSLMAHNAPEISPLAGVRALLILVLGTLLALLVLQRWIGDKQRCAMLCSLFILLFFSYGHVYYGLVTQSSFNLFSRLGLIGNHWLLGGVWILLFIIIVLGILRSRLNWESIGRLMTGMALVTLFLPLAQLVRFEFERRKAWPMPRSIETQAGDTAASSKPDIYYIILDGYGRADVLETFYAFDNQSFLDFLESQGFFVAGQSRSNYVQTSLSLASSLNVEYLDKLLSTSDAGADARLALMRMIRSNTVRDYLEKQGYQIVAFDSGYRPTELDNADRYFAAPQRAVTPLEGLLMETSALPAVQALASGLGAPTYYPGYQSHRDLVNYLLDNIPEAVDLSAPKFVFAHIVIPHPPFVFGPDGEEIHHHFRFSFMDGDAFPGTQEEYRSGYRDQLAYLNGRVEKMILSILARSERPPIIILQGDHGPGMQLDYESAANTNMQERLGILNAYFLPGYPEDQLPSTITPVNSFRLIFAHYFGADLPLLPDRSYYSTWSQPFNFLDVTTASE
jgi:hypothetical protein